MSDSSESALASAQVVLRGAGGRAPSGQEAVTAANVAEFAPAQATVERTMAAFRALGFRAEGAFANSFSITATFARFEATFGVRLAPTAGGGLEVASEGGPSTQELPVGSLPADVRDEVVAVALPRPPDFGPGNP